MERSYKEEWIAWGMATVLQSLLMYQKPPYTVQDLMNIARWYGVEEQLIDRMSYVPNSLDGYVE